MSFPAYPSYKDSGVDWLGQVPDHWTSKKIKRIASFEGGGTPARENPDFWNGDITWVSPKDMKFERIVASEEKITSVGLNAMAGNLICSGAVLIVVRSGILRHTIPVAIADRAVALNQDMKALCFDSTECLPDFFLRWVQGLNDNLLFEWLKQGATVESVEHDYLAETAVPLPPLSEQAAIAGFLDRETAKIDALVEEQRRLIALLKEKRQAIISHAITKGLNPDVPVKNSGVEWIGEVPKHWIVTAAGRNLQILSGFAFPSEGFSLDPEHTRLLRGVNVGLGRVRWDETVYWPRSPGDGLSAFELSEGELVIGMDRPWIAGGVRIAKLAASDLPCLLLQRVAALQPTQSLDVDYLHLLLSSPAFVDYFTPDMTGVSVPHLSPSQIKAFPIPLPPLAEQRAIVAHVQLRATEAGQLIAAAEEAMGLLSERRSALISAAVTGKIDVRNAGKVLPFPVDHVRVRGLIGAEIIERSAHQPTFGRVKLQKIAYLAEAHAGVTELDGSYLREAAGPLDREMIREMEREAGALAGVRIEQPGGAGSAVVYRLGEHCGAHRQDLAVLLGDRVAKFDKLIEDIGTIDTKGAEAVATLYAVWNDALIGGDTPSDMEIKLAVLSEWHPEKAKKFDIKELQIWLDWMRRHGLVPTGTGPKTTTGRLFA